MQLKGFSTSAAAELAYVIGQLQSTSPLKTLILDLRGNPGGLLSSAIKVPELRLCWRLKKKNPCSQLNPAS